MESILASIKVRSPELCGAERLIGEGYGKLGRMGLTFGYREMQRKKDEVARHCKPLHVGQCQFGRRCQRDTRAYTDQRDSSRNAVERHPINPETRRPDMVTQWTYLVSSPVSSVYIVTTWIKRSVLVQKTSKWARAVTGIEDDLRTM